MGYTGLQDMNDLTVNATHTYYVVAGGAPILVHNCGSFDQWMARNGDEGWTVYHGVDQNGDAIYAGITKNLAKRQAQHVAKKYGIARLVAHTTGLRKWEARSLEQRLIEGVRASGRSRMRGGLRIGQINSISPKRNQIYRHAMMWARFM